ncbi:MAG: hypothetical protein WD492_18940 [Alkalispirochaeta sp.]
MWDTRGALYRELYHFLTAELHGARPSSATARDLPRPLARSLVHFYALLKTATLETLTANVADLVAGEVSQWFQQVWRDLEEVASPEHTRSSPASREQRLQEYRRRYPSAEAEWLTLETRLRHSSSPAALAAIDHLMEKTRITCEERERETMQERGLRRAVTPLADHLNRVVPGVADADRRCRNLFHRPGEWQIFDETSAQLPWHRLERAHERLEGDVDMQRLSDALVRGVSRPETRVVWRKVPVEVISTEETDRGLGDVDGLHGISGVQSALPGELGLLATPPTEDLFARKLAEQGVLALHSNRFQTHTTSRTVHEWRRVPAEYRPGPIIVCLDTSGSMQGVATEIAESLVFGMVRAAIAYQRRISVIAVRGRLRHVTIESPETESTPDAVRPVGNVPVTAGSPSRVREGDILALHRFFDASRSGGADISPALEVALGEIGPDDEGVVDLVVVSDMQFPRISAAHQVALDELQRRGVATAHAITIGELAMRDPMNVFDHRWHYNTGHDALSRGLKRYGMVGFRYEHIPI